MTEETTFKYGDIDKNGEVNAKDAADLLESILKGGITDHHRKYGNLDKTSPELTASDASIILQIALGKLSYEDIQ